MYTATNTITGATVGTYAKEQTARAVISRKVNASITAYAKGKPSTPRYSVTDFNISKQKEDSHANSPI